MDTKKQDTIAKLYALRAGLSVISQKKDAVSSIYAQCDKSISAYNRQQTQEKNERENVEKQLESAQIRINSKTHSNVLKFTANILLLILSLGLLIVIGLYAFYSTYCQVMLDSSEMEPWWDGLSFFTFIPACILTVVALVFFIIRLIKFIANTTDIIKSTHINRSIIREARSNIPKYENQIKEIETRLSTIQSYKDTAKKKASIASLPYITECNIIDKALIKSFSTFIDPRDWEHIDLIIFFMESGRADSMKEALQQVDQEVRTNRIIGAIQNAGIQISQAISEGLSSMQTTMVKCFSIISTQINIISTQQMNALAQLSNRINDISGQLKAVSTNLNNINFSKALSAKSNATSEQLISDVHYMRTLAENAEIRRRNNT